MHRSTIFFGLLTAICLSTACSNKNIAIELASPKEILPQPAFTIGGAAPSGERLNYSQVRVYELADQCSPPQCRIMWHIAVAGVNSPKSILYGAVPSFGNFVIVPPKLLKAGHVYRFIADSPESSANRAHGSFDFTIDQNQNVIPAKSGKP